MKLTSFIVATTVVVAATLNFGVQGSPRPQLDINLGPTKVLSLDPLGILFGRPTKPTPAAAPIGTRPTLIVTPSPPIQSIVVNPTPAPTIAQPDVALCARNCKGTPEYNPVCGSDGIMYNNPGQLICARNCGIDVTQLRTGRCPAPAPTVTPNAPTPAPATAQPDVALCARNCKGTPEYNPVCGSDGIMYNNPGQLICARNCGINVAQLHTGRCSAPTPKPESSTIVPMPTTFTQKAPTPAPEAIPLDALVCAENCMVTEEYNPVCGTDGVTYRNAGLLICTRNCGINVAQLHTGRCSAPTLKPESSTIVPMPTTVTQKAPTPAPEAIPLDALVCAQNCLVTEEYNPVCGTDGVTYRNAGLLICTRNCGINVTQRSYGPCNIALVDRRP